MSSPSEDRPGRFLWLLPGMRPPVVLPRRQEVVFLLVGTTILFSGYDLNVFGLALPQIQKALHIPEDQAALTVTWFRLATLAALFIAPLADLFGRRRLLLFTVFGEALFTMASAFAQTYPEYVWLQIFTRTFGYCEEMLCFVVIAEEIDEKARGWSIGTLGAMNGTGAGLCSLVFALVNVLPFGWRSLYLVGGGALFVLAYFRRWMKETKRFEVRKQELAALGNKGHAFWDTLSRLVKEHPRRLAAMLIAVGCFGFGVGPAVILMSKYMQETHHYHPWQVTVLYVFGGFLSVAGNVLVGRVSDFVGRKPAMFGCVLICGASFVVFYSGIDGWLLPVSWIVAIFGYLSSDALMAGCPAEIFPTAYRATTATLRYVVSTLAGAASLALEGVFYDWFGAHSIATMLPLAVMPLGLIAILFLPETAGKTLEEIAEAHAAG
jgi:putative MFS transporter